MILKTPLLIINLKEYNEALGDKPMIFANTARKLLDKYKINILIAPPDPMIDNISKIILTVSQHMDPYEPGAHTGALLAKEIKELGAVGSLINHSEKRIPAEDIKKCVELCKEYDLVSIVCAQTNKEAGELAKLNPDFIAVEPPELIGGDVSVSTAEPEIITDTVGEVKKNSLRSYVLCGAGIKNKADVKRAIELGAKGVLVASGVVKSYTVENTMEELIKGML